MEAKVAENRADIEKEKQKKIQDEKDRLAKIAALEQKKAEEQVETAKKSAAEAK